MSAIDGALLEISRMIEAVFDEIEYRQAKAARARAAKPTIAFRSFRMPPLVDDDNLASADFPTRDT